jgi:hypothetical protein
MPLVIMFTNAKYGRDLIGIDKQIFEIKNSSRRNAAINVLFTKETDIVMTSSKNLAS